MLKHAVCQVAMSCGIPLSSWTSEVMGRGIMLVDKKKNIYVYI